MAKSDVDHARQLLGMAEKDLHALANMQDAADFAEEVFGFHAQQVIEKSLKAWVSYLGLTYPKSHDLGYLVRLLERAGADLTSIPDWRISRYSRSSIETKRTTIWMLSWTGPRLSRWRESSCATSIH